MIKYIYNIAAIFAIAGLTTTSPLMAKKEPVSLSPSSQWVLNINNEECSLNRRFGEGEDNVIVFISRYQPTDWFEIYFVSKRFNKRSGNKPIKIQFGSENPVQTAEFSRGLTDQNTPALILSDSLRITPPSETEQRILAQKNVPAGFSIAHIREEQERKVDFIKFTPPRSPEISLKTNTMEAAFKALRDCNDGLLNNWGIDVEKHKAITRFATPKSSPQDWIRSGDYPRTELKKGHIAIIQFRLKIDTSGRASDCFIQRSIGDEAFDKAVCRNLLKRSEFNPALDKDGNPMTSYYINKVRFQIPN